MITAADQNQKTEPLVDYMKMLIAYVRSDRPDLTNRQMALLMVVYLLPGPHTVRGLALTLHCRKPVVTRMLNALGAMGYLRRQKDHTDLRSLFVVYTPAGVAFLEEFTELAERARHHSGL